MQFILLEIDDVHNDLWFKKNHEPNLLKLLNVKTQIPHLCIFSTTIKSNA